MNALPEIFLSSPSLSFGSHFYLIELRASPDSEVSVKKCGLSKGDVKGLSMTVAFKKVASPFYSIPIYLRSNFFTQDPKLQAGGLSDKCMSYSGLGQKIRVNGKKAFFQWGSIVSEGISNTECIGPYIATLRVYKTPRTHAGNYCLLKFKSK